jgi:hypothetical protein
MLELICLGVEVEVGWLSGEGRLRGKLGAFVGCRMIYIGVKVLVHFVQAIRCFCFESLNPIFLPF